MGAEEAPASYASFVCPRRRSVECTNIYFNSMSVWLKKKKMLLEKCFEAKCEGGKPVCSKPPWLRMKPEKDPARIWAQNGADANWWWLLLQTDDDEKLVFRNAEHNLKGRNFNGKFQWINSPSVNIGVCRHYNAAALDSRRGEGSLPGLLSVALQQVQLTSPDHHPWPSEQERLLL